LPPNPSKEQPRHQEFESDSDSAREFLESLERQRGSRLLNETDYRELRGWVLMELEKGPHLRIPTLLTFGVVGLLLFAFLLIGLEMLTDHNSREWLLALASGCCLLLWGYFLWRYVAGIREQARMSLQERLTELEDLRHSNLISQTEFEKIYAALHMSRGVPPS